MFLPVAAIDAAFKASTPRDSVAILFLIEDSCAMATLWSNLHDFYLPQVIGAIKNANPSVPVQVLWMPTSHLKPIEFQHGAPARRSKRWNEIPALNFGQLTSNKVSPATVSRAIDALTLAFGRTQTSRHLMVIAVSNHTSDSPVRSETDTLSWLPVVHKLHHESTRLHMIVRSQLNMSGLTSLFWETIKMDLSKPTVTDDAHYIFYLRNEAENMRQFVSTATTSQFARQTTSTMHDAMSDAKSTTSSIPNIHRPSLVFQLQKMNGMEKKRRSRARRDTVATNKPGRPYQKLHGRNSLPASPSPDILVRPVVTRTRITDEIAEGTSNIHAHSRDGTSGDTAPYSTTTSPARSLSPSSPRYQFTSATASPSFTESQPVYDPYRRALVCQAPSSLSPTYSEPSELANYQADMPGASIRSNQLPAYPGNPQSQTHMEPNSAYADPPLWTSPQRGPGVADSQLVHPPVYNEPISCNRHMADATEDSAQYPSHSGNYAESSAQSPSFYNGYNPSIGYYYDYGDTNVAESARYNFSTQSSSLHPPPVSSFGDCGSSGYGYR